MARGGFTLVETIFSTLFISLTVLAIVNLFPGAYMSVKKSETRLQSDMIAASIIDELRSRSFQTISQGVATASVGEPVAIPISGDDDPIFGRQVIDGIEYIPEVSAFRVENTDPAIVIGVRVNIEYRVGTLKQNNVHETILHTLSK